MLKVNVKTAYSIISGMYDLRDTVCSEKQSVGGIKTKHTSISCKIDALSSIFVIVCEIFMFFAILCNSNTLFVY